MAAWPLRLGLALAVLAGSAAAQSVPTYHGAADRGGLYVTPRLTWATAATVHADPAFAATISGNVYAQPLYWLPPNASTGFVIVTTESNTVYALHAATGAVAWQRNLGPTTDLGRLPCGNINPVGITGTPVIDPASGILYLDTLYGASSAPRHRIYALDLATGKTLHGWPVGVEEGLKSIGVKFQSPAQGQRSALTLMNGLLYVSYGGAFGDCLPYRGRVVELELGTPKITAHWATRAQRGGIWAQSGIASDGTSLFVTTGNTTTAGAHPWGDGEAVIRLQPGLVHSTAKADFFTPSNWLDLDNSDTDLGGTGPLPIDVPSGGSVLHRLIQFGKDGKAYLLDRANLGGIGGQLAVTPVASTEIISAAARFPTATAAMVAIGTPGSRCPAGQSGNLTMLSVTASPTTPITTAWCAAPNRVGAPIVTTSDGTNNPIVWAVETSGGQLRGFRGTDGVQLFAGGTLSGLQSRVTILVAERHFYIAGTGHVFAFTW